jgi:predicted enzyme related to lactoylglutathione lyase
MEETIAFYRDVLGFELDFHPAPGFARLKMGDLTLLLNAPGSGGAGAETEAGRPQPGGWNRFQLTSDDLDADLERFQEAGARLRTGIVQGMGGRQVLIEDPSGNLVEIFEPA